MIISIINKDQFESKKYKIRYIYQKNLGSINKLLNEFKNEISNKKI